MLLRDNKNCFSETNINNNRVNKIIFLVLPIKWKVYTIEHLNWGG